MLSRTAFAMRALHCLILIAIVPLCSAQDLDRLRTVANDSSRADTGRLHAMYDLIWNNYLQTAPDSAFLLAGRMALLARKVGAVKWEADAVHIQGVASYYQGEYDKALSCYHKSLAMRQAIKDTDGIARSLNNIGNIQKEQGNYPAAIKNYERCRDLWAELGDKAGIASALNNIGIILSEQGDYTGSFEHHQQSLALKEEVHDSLGIATSLNNIATIYHSQGDYAKSIELYTRCLQLNEKLGRKSGMALSLGNLGTVYTALGDNVRAMDFFRRSLAISEGIGDKSNAATTLYNIGIMYADAGDHDRALENYTLCLKMWEDMEDKSGVATALESMGGLLMDHGDTAAAHADYERSLALWEAVGDKSGTAGSLDHLGRLCTERKEYAKALAYHERSRKLREQLNDKSGLSSTLTNIGTIQQRTGHYQEAIASGERALALAQSIGNVENIKRASFLLQEAFASVGRTDRALPMYKLYITMRDSVQNRAANEKVIRMEARYDYQKMALADSLEHANGIAQLEKEKTIERLRADRNRNRALGFGGGILLLFAGATAYFISDRKHRKARFEKEAATLETQALRSQMNPHFIFNALNSISAFVQKNQPDAAVSFLSRFARLMRLVLENSRQSEVPLKDDLEALDAYMHLERARGGEKFDYTITVDPAIDQENTLVPPLVIQPFVENAIWHGMAGKEGKGHITLSVTKRGDQLVMAIEDNGVGRNAPKQVVDGAPKKSSLATAITQARLDLVQKQKGKPAGFAYIDLPQGTRVELSLPISEAA